MPSAFSWPVLVPCALRATAPVNLGVRLFMLKRLLKIALVLLSLLAAMVALGAYGLYTLGDSMCGNDIITESLSPDKELKAVVFRRDCGATTGFSTQVSILGVEEQLENENGNVFTADADHGAAPTYEMGGPVVTVQWTERDKLTVFRSPSARVFKTVDKRAGVHITYQLSTP